MTKPKPCGNAAATRPAPTLHKLGDKELDHLTRRWQAALGMCQLCRVNPTTTPATYAGSIPVAGVSVPVQVRVFRRTNKLQPHHVAAFLGELTRAGTGVGILATTGECARGTLQLAQEARAPHIRLLTGREWAAELSRLGIPPHPSGTSRTPKAAPPRAGAATKRKR